MAFADERSEMMFAHRRDGYIFYQHHFVVRISRQRDDLLSGVDPHSFGQFDIKLCDALRRFLKAFTVGVFAYTFEQETYTSFDLIKVDFLSRFSYHRNYAAEARDVRLSSANASL